MNIHGFFVKGAIDEETRCKHYHSECDRIAIKFYCCNEFFPCYFCHLEHGCGNEAVWPFDQFDERAILCGTCGYVLTIAEYFNHHDACPNCNVQFNQGCQYHHHLYFNTNKS